MKKILILIIMITILSINVEADASSKVINNWDFEGDYTDQVSQHNLSAKAGISQTTGFISTTAITCDGTSDSYLISNHSMKSVKAISMWIKPNEDAAKYLIHQGNTYQLYATGSSKMRQWTGGGSWIQNGGITIGAWQLLYIEINGTSSKFYSNNTDTSETSTVNINEVNGTTVFSLCAYNPPSPSLFYSAEIDELTFYNDYLTTTERQQIMDNPEYPFSAGGSNPPTITKNTYNHSTAFDVANQTIWRTTQSTKSSTSDTTPTIIFDIDQSGNCSIGKTNQNHTTMIGADADTKCSTTETTTHTCTLPTSQKLGAGTNNLYIACITDTGKENTTSTSTALNTEYTTRYYTGTGTWLHLTNETFTNNVTNIKNMTIQGSIINIMGAIFNIK